MLQVDVSLVLESSRLDLGSHCTLCKSAQHHHLWTKRPFAPTSSSTVLVFCLKVIFQIFARQLAQMTRNVSCVVYSSLFIIAQIHTFFDRISKWRNENEWKTSSFANPIKEIEGQGKKEWISIWFLLLLLLLYAFLVFRLPLALKR